MRARRGRTAGEAWPPGRAARLAHDAGEGGGLGLAAPAEPYRAEEPATAHLLALQQLAHRADRPAGHVVGAQHAEDPGFVALREPDAEEIVELGGVRQPLVRGRAQLGRPRRVADRLDQALPHVLLGGEHLGPAVAALHHPEHGDLAQRARVEVAVVGPFDDVLAAERHRRLLPRDLDRRQIAIGARPAREPAEDADRRRRPGVEFGDARGHAQRRPVRVTLVADAAVEEIGLAPGVVRGQVRRRPLGVRPGAPEGRDRDGQPAAPRPRQRVEVHAESVPVRGAVRVDQHVRVRDQPQQRLAPAGPGVVELDAALARADVGEERGGVRAGGDMALAAQGAAAGRLERGHGRAEVDEHAGGVGGGGALAVLEHAQPVQQGWRGGQALARGGAHRSAPASSSAVIPASLMPRTSRSTSALCWPSIGAGARTAPGVSLRRIACP